MSEIVNAQGERIQKDSAHAKIYKKLLASPEDSALRLDRELLQEAMLDMLNTSRLLQMAMARIQNLVTPPPPPAPEEDVSEDDIQSEEPSS